MKLAPVSSVKQSLACLRDSTTVESAVLLYAPNVPNTSSRCLSLHTTSEWGCAATAWKNSTKKEKSRKSEKEYSPTTSVGEETRRRVNTSTVSYRGTRRCHHEISAIQSSRSSQTWTLSWCTQDKMGTSSIQYLVKHSSIVQIEVRTLHLSKQEAKVSRRMAVWRRSKTDRARAIAHSMITVGQECYYKKHQSQVQMIHRDKMLGHQSSERIHSNRHALVLDVFSIIRKQSSQKQLYSTENLKQELTEIWRTSHSPETQWTRVWSATTQPLHAQTSVQAWVVWDQST